MAAVKDRVRLVQDGLDVLEDWPEPVSDPYPDSHRSLPGCHGPDIDRLVTMFPHLSIEQAIILYNQHGQQTREVISSLLETPGHPEESSYQDAQTVLMTLDTLFAVTLQEQFGRSVDDSLLQFLKTGEMLSMDIPISLARQIFTLWQSSLQSVLINKPVLETAGNPAAVGLTAAPKTVLALNAAEHYEKEMLG